MKRSGQPLSKPKWQGTFNTGQLPFAAIFRKEVIGQSLNLLSTVAEVEFHER
jgi:hypothetical protein